MFPANNNSYLRLREINLRHNNISRISQPFPDFYEHAADQGLTLIDISFNPLPCHCELKWLVQRLASDRSASEGGIFFNISRDDCTEGLQSLGCNCSLFNSWDGNDTNGTICSADQNLKTSHLVLISLGCLSLLFLMGIGFGKMKLANLLIK